MNGKSIRRGVSPLIVAALFAGGLAAQVPEEGSGPLPPADLDLPVSIQSVMLSLIDPAAHYLWDYAARAEELGEEQWDALAHVATQLAAAGPLIRMGGTGAEDQGWSSERQWILFSRDMQRAALDALGAAQTRDPAALTGASGRLTAACNGCHQVYRPSLELEELHEITPGGLYRSL